MKNQDWRFCLAPMMDWSDRHCRYFWRLLSRRARLYTEMVTTGALLYGDAPRFLQFNAEEHPVALQLGGSNPADLMRCAQLAEQWGYDEVNLNCGCPSDRVQNGRIGACLMAEAKLVGECIQAMQQVVQIPVTVKIRIGIDHQDSFEHLQEFVATVSQAGCDVFIVHARKAWLQGLSPKQNREVPPLRYGCVHRLKTTFPNQTIVINGGLETIADCQQQLAHVDGVMVGRAAYHNPYLLAQVDQELFAEQAFEHNRDEVLEQYIDYCRSQLQQGARLNHMTRHIMGLYLGQSGARRFRRYISENATQTGADERVLMAARQQMEM